MDNNEKIIQFHINTMDNDITVTHGYNISNSFPIHFHSTFNLGIIEQGHRKFLYRGKWITLNPDDIFIIQPHEPHCCKSPNGKHSYKIISFYGDSSAFFPNLEIHNNELLSEIRYFHNIAEHENTSLLLPSLFKNIINRLFLYASHPEKQQNTNETLHRIEKAKTYIENNCLRELSLKEMSDAACLSEFYFNRLFHHAYGLSPYAYYLMMKVKRSQEFLHTRKSIIEAGYEVGFFDQSHFTKEFKKQVGVTPGKFIHDNNQ